MAKKKETELQYLQYPLPQGGRPGKMTKLDWSGLNYRNTKDTGEISKELNISTHFAPFLSPSEMKKEIKSGLFDKYWHNDRNENFAGEKLKEKDSARVSKDIGFSIKLLQRS